MPFYSKGRVMNVNAKQAHSVQCPFLRKYLPLLERTITIDNNQFHCPPNEINLYTTIKVHNLL